MGRGNWLFCGLALALIGCGTPDYTGTPLQTRSTLATDAGQKPPPPPKEKPAKPEPEPECAPSDIPDGANDQCPEDLPRTLECEGKEAEDWATHAGCEKQEGRDRKHHEFCCPTTVAGSSSAPMGPGKPDAGPDAN